MDKQSKALITFNDEPEDAISALNGAACPLKMLAGRADAGICQIITMAETITFFIRLGTEQGIIVTLKMSQPSKRLIGPF